MSSKKPSSTSRASLCSERFLAPGVVDGMTTGSRLVCDVSHARLTRT